MKRDNSGHSVGIVPWKKVVARSILSTLIFLPGLVSAASAQESRTVRLANFLPENNAMSRAMKKWGDSVSARTAGKLKFQYFWSGSLLAAADTLQGITDGRADGGNVAFGYYPAQFPLSSIDTIPFMAKSVSAYASALQKMYTSDDALKAEFDRNRIHLIGTMPGGVNIIFAKKPIDTFKKLEGVRVRAMGLGADAAELAGAAAVGLPQTQVYESLNKGLLDATSGVTLDIGVDFGFHNVARYIVYSNYGPYASSVFAISKRLYDSLSPEFKGIIDDESAKFLDTYYLPEMAAAEESRCQKLKQSGATLIAWNNDEANQWRTAAAGKVKAKWVSQMAPKGNLDEAGANALLDRYNAAIEKAQTSAVASAAEKCFAK